MIGSASGNLLRWASLRRVFGPFLGELHQSRRFLLVEVSIFTACDRGWAHSIWTLVAEEAVWNNQEWNWSWYIHVP